MKLGIMRRMIATGLCMAMLLGDVFPAVASASVSSGDAQQTLQEDNTVSGGDIQNTGMPENTHEPSVSDGDMADVILTTSVNGVDITLTAPAGSVPADAQLWAEEIAQTEQLAVIDELLEAEARKEAAEIQQYKAFDIKILVNGEAVQPAEGVKVTFAGDVLLPQNKEESVAVYHVTEDAVANDMEATVTGENTVEMETSHFSTYVIVVSSSEYSKHITINHYLGDKNNHSTIYAPTELTVAPDQYLKTTDLPVQGGRNYTVTQVSVTSGGMTRDYTNDVTNNNEVKIELNSPENVIDIYYKENSLTYSNGTTFFDYYVDGWTEKTVTKNAEIYNYNQIGADFTINNNTQVYKSDSYFRTSHNNNKVWLELKKSSDWWNGTDEYILKDGDTLHFKNGTPDWVYNKKERKFQYVATERTYAAFDAGINAGADHTKPYLAMGLSSEGWNGGGDTYRVTSHYNFFITKNGKACNFNANNTDSGGRGEGEYAIMPGLLARLDDPDGDKSYSQVVMGTDKDGRQIQEPGYFTSETSDNKEIYENYSLHFKQTGNTYVLDYAQNDMTERKTYSYASDRTVNRQFFPLDDVTPIGGRQTFEPTNWDGSDRGTKNFYFSMRYDFSFSVGDYVGPMIYEFMGDDDLWVFVDGKLALDLGGMHSAYPGNYYNTPDENTVDLWKFLYNVTDEKGKLALTDEQKSETHTVTILYMERGGYESSCAMKFVIPNVEAKAPVISNIPRANLELVKKNSDTGSAVANVGFTLYTNEACTSALTGEKFTDANGNVSFTNLYEGTYYLKETSYDANVYEANTSVYKVVVRKTGELTPAGDEIAEAVIEGLTKDGSKYVIWNSPIKKVDLEFNKIDKYTNEGLTGVKFALYRKDGMEKIAETVTAQDGYFKFTGIEKGTYCLVEIYDKLSGYEKPGKDWTIVVSEQNGDLVYEVTDGPEGLWSVENSRICIVNNPYVSFGFYKTDSSDGHAMSGVEFKLYKGLGNDKSEWIATVSSDEKGFVEFSKLEVGQEYLLVETTPEGYVQTTAWVVRVDYDATKKCYVEKLYDAVLDEGSNSWEYDRNRPYEVQDAYKRLVIENIPAEGSLVIHKTIDKLKMVYGAASFTFKIEGSKGTVLYRTITFDNAEELSKSITIDNLPVGEYTVTELDNLRYDLAEYSVTVNGTKRDNFSRAEVTEDSKPVFSFVNKQKPGKYYSHSDIVVNSFRRNDSGEIVVSREREVTEEKEFIVE